MKHNKLLNLGKKKVGFNQQCYFIADIAANHDGDLSRAIDLVHLAAEAGADAAKFQNFKASTIVSKTGFNALGGRLSHQSSWHKSVYEVYEDAAINQDWTPILKQECNKVGIDYFTSPYDFDAVDHVDPYVDMYKIGSGDITWLELCDYIASKGKPVLLATGASTMQDVERAMQVLLAKNPNIVLMQCNTNYSGSLENFKYINLSVLKTYADKWPDVILGLSDHTPGWTTVLGAVAYGARVIEKHFTDDNHRTGPDHAFSMVPNTWREMVLRTREMEFALGDGIKRIEKNELETSVIQRRSLYTTRSLSAGHILKKADLIPLRPCVTNAIAPYNIDEVIGRKIHKALHEGECLIQEVLK